MTHDFIDPLRVGPETLLAGAPGGPLDGVDVAVKDIIDVAGVATGGGNPEYLAAADPAATTAPAVQRLVDAGARVIGKAHTDEFAWSLSGTNHHYGTPRNPAAPGRVPGGSSSGSASAVAGGLVPLAVGTDTAGSIRVPAAYCGIWGLRPSHGRVPMGQIMPLARSFDTVGLFAADGALLERAGLVLLASQPGDPPRQLVVATDLLARADPDVAEAVKRGAQRLASALTAPVTDSSVDDAGRLDCWLEAFRQRQMVEAWQADGPWLTEHRPALGPGVASRFAAASQTPPRRGARATEAGIQVRHALDAILPPGGALVMPSAATVAPDLDQSANEDLRGRTMALTCLAGLAGAPAVGLPLGSAEGLPVGVCLLGRVGDDERLLAAARVMSASSG